MGYFGPLFPAFLIVTPLIAACAWVLQTPTAARISGGSDASMGRKWIPAFVTIGAILLLSSAYFSAANTLRIIGPVARAVAPVASPHSTVSLNFVLRRAAHVGVYGLLFLVAYNGPLRGRRGWALWLCLAVAMLDEGHQALLPERSGLLSDVILDGLGAIIAALVDVGVRAQVRPKLQLPKTSAPRA